MNRYAELFARRRGLVAAFVGLVTLVAFVGIAQLEFDDEPRGIFQADDEEWLILQALYDDFGSDDNEAFLVLEAEDWFTPERIALLKRIDAEALALEGVERVTGMTEVVVFGDGIVPRPFLPPADATTAELAAARAAAHAHPFVGGRLLSSDGRTTLMAARLAGGALHVGEIEPIVERLRELVREVSETPGVRARLTGVPCMRVEVYDLIQSEQRRFTLWGAALCVLVALLIFRNLGAVMATMLPPVIGMTWTFGAIGWMGAKIDLLSTALPMLVICIGFTDSVHLMIDMRRSRAGGESRLDAARDAIRHLGMPCLLTSLTTAVGFGSLAIGNILAIRRFGVLCSLGVVLTFVAVITTAPLLASWLKGVGGGRPGAKPASAWLIGRAGSLVDAITRHAGLVSLAGMVVVLVLGFFCTRIVPETTLMEATPRDYETFHALRHVEEAFGGVLPFYMIVQWEEREAFDSPAVLAAVRDSQALFSTRAELVRPVSAVDLFELLPGNGDERAKLLAGMPPELVGRFLRPDRRKALVVSAVPDLGTRALQPMLDALEAGVDELHEKHPGIEFHLTGSDVVARRNIKRMIVDLARGIFIASVIIFGVIALEFRSLRLGLLSLVPNVFPLVLVGALMVWTDTTLQIATAILFSVLLGLAVDDTIHFLARYRRELAVDGDVRPALRRTFLTVGAAIVTTTLVLTAGFAIVLTTSVPTTQIFAVLLCVGLISALAGDLIFLPALLSFFRRR
ncbi:MAG: MMPL family transporter [Planctomycetota bacterium]|nr:MMPL family transporter [Planctomycetota bacterium]